MINILSFIQRNYCYTGFQINNLSVDKTNLQIVGHGLNSLVEVASARCQYFTAFLFPTNKFLG